MQSLLLENMIRSPGVRLIVPNTPNHLMMMNAEAERLPGWTRAELAGRSAQDIIPLLDGCPFVAAERRSPAALQHQ